MEPRHLFVYGSLRPDGEAFSSLLGDVALDAKDCVLEDHALYGRGMSYPVVVAEPGSSVAGSLIQLRASDLAETLAALDRYEGDAYRRVEVAVSGPDGSVPAHLYVAAPDVRLAPAQRISSGDWMDR